MKTLKVQGKGEVSIIPDICLFAMIVTEKRDDYAGCHCALNSRVERIRERLVAAGVDPVSIKTSDYSVSPVTAYSGKLGRNLPDGYQGRHRLAVEIPLQKDRMNSVFATLAEGSDDPSISISFAVSDRDAVRKQLLRNAVAAAAGNAETIADAAGLVLGSIVSVEYGWNEVRFGIEPDYDQACCSGPAEGTSPDIEPNELGASDTVTVVYEIV